MSITRVGTTKKYSDGWDNIFSGGKSRAATKTKSAKPAKSSAKKKPAKKKSSTRAVKKSSRRK